MPRWHLCDQREAGSITPPDSGIWRGRAFHREAFTVACPQLEPFADQAQLAEYQHRDREPHNARVQDALRNLVYHFGDSANMKWRSPVQVRFRRGLARCDPREERPQMS